MTVVLDGAVTHGGLNAADRARLVALHDVLAPHFPTIADACYAIALGHARTAAVVSAPGRGAALRATLIDWMSAGLLGRSDDACHATRAKLADLQAELGLAAHELVIALNPVRRAYRERIASAYPLADQLSVGGAVDQLLDLEVAVLVRNCQIDSEARLVASERDRRVQQLEAMQTLCAGLAHEVRNPLNSAKLQLQLAARRLRRGGDDPRLVEPIDLAGHEIDRLTVLLDEFLAFARPPALDVHPHEVTALVQDVIDRARPLAARRGAALTLVDGTVPVLAEIDAAKIRQVVENLVCNAIEAVLIRGHVSVAVEHVDDQVHIRVSDDGPGIPSAVLPRIYEPFFSTKEGGTGMGMSIAHSLVALHRGSIDVASAPGATTFRITVPRSQRTGA